MVSTVAVQTQLQLNTLSTVFNDIKSVTHDTESRQLVIELRESRRCDNPTFMVRMSGTSLYLLDLVEHVHTPMSIRAVKEFFYPRSNIYHFSYPPLVDPGTYFIEATVTFCSSFDPNDFRRVCLETVQDGLNVINLPYSFTLTSPQKSETNPPVKRARWVLHNTTTPTLLPTRYQTRNCGDGVYCDAEWSDLEHHREYSWVDQPDWRVPLKRILAKGDASGVNTSAVSAVVNVCFIGASHARELMLHGQELLKIGKLVQFVWIESKYPAHLNLAQLHQYDCSYAVIGYGQWPVSYYEKAPYTQQRFTHEMRAMMQTVKSYSGTTLISMRSVNYNALGGIITYCPPVDHRSPPVIDMLNSVIKTLTTDLDIPYIDLNPVMGPMWDSALDWCHPKGKVFTAEAEHVLYSLFTTSLAQNKLPKLFPGTAAPPENSLYRFTNDQTVYLYKDKELHSFPNGRTFMGMGFEFDQVVVLVESKRSTFDFGEPLPSLQ